MDIEKICAALRVLPTTEELMEAEKTLYALQAENEKLRAELDEKEKYYDQMIDALSATDSAELEQVKQERDEAVQCIRGIAKGGRVWMCPYCVHAEDTTGGIAECELDVGVCMMPYSKFEWLGQKED